MFFISLFLEFSPILSYHQPYSLSLALPVFLSSSESTTPFSDRTIFMIGRVLHNCNPVKSSFSKEYPVGSSMCQNIPTSNFGWISSDADWGLDKTLAVIRHCTDADKEVHLLYYYCRKQ